MRRLIFHFQKLLLLSICSLIFNYGTVDAAHAFVISSRQTTDDKRAGQLIAEAIAALERGDEGVAKASFERALAIEPNNVTAHTYLGVFADRAGDLKEAERHFAAAAIAAPLLPSARNNHGAILIKLGRTAQALKQFEASLRLDKNQPNALFNLAQIRFAEGTPEGFRASQNLFEQAYALAPDAETARALTIVALRLDDRDAAVRYFQQYTERLAGLGAESLPRAAARAELGGALLEAGLAREAVTELNSAVAADSSNTNAIIRLARAYLTLKDIPAAGRTLESAVARGLVAAPIYALLAEVYQQSNHIENAIPAMRLAIQSDPQSESYRFKYGMLLTGALAPAAAIIRLEEALKLFPRSPRLWFALGIAQFKQGRNDEAAKAFKRALEFDGKFAPALAYLGLTYEELGQFEEALRLYDAALAVDEKMAVASYLAAIALLKQNSADLSRVENYLAHTIKLDSSFAEARLSLAKVFIRRNRFEEAVAELERVAKLAPDLAETYYHLGRLYVRLKRQAEAQAAIATFKRLSELQKEQSQIERREIVRRLANVNY